MKITKQPSSVIVTFSPDEYFLTKDETGWSLSYRIDRSEKGKEDDVGTTALILEDGQEKIFKDAGFTWIEI